MSYKFLYIDDTKNAVEQGTINGLQDGGELEIAWQPPKAWEDQMSSLTNELSDANGLILDLRLGDTEYTPGKRAQYRGTTVAQELRTLAKEKTIAKDFPIILFSGNENLSKSLDQTGLDLFDKIVSKTNVQGDGFSYKKLKTDLIWLSDGYDYLNRFEKSLAAILSVPDGVDLDIRFAAHFNDLLEKQPIHVVAKFLITEVIQKPGFLISEDYLAARLGVDKQSPDWPQLLDKLSPCLYHGAFSSDHPRWWVDLVERFWQEKISTQEPIRLTHASRRIELLIEKTGFHRLVAPKQTPKSKSDTFWVVCKVTKMPIDPVDGFLLMGKNALYEWQEPEYISVEEALRPSTDLRISPLETDRLAILKVFYEKHEQRIRK